MVPPPEVRLRRGQVLTWARPPWDEEDVPRHFSVLYADDDLLVVDKPSGLPTMPAGGFLENTLPAVVRERWPAASPAHRLGRGTSGAVVFALRDRARAQLPRAWNTPAVEKHYLAVLGARPPWDTLDVQVVIGEHPHPALGTVFAAGGDRARPARTVFTVLRCGDETLIHAQISTGRPHQIRIHAAAVGFPLAGDPLYGPGGLPRSDALPGDLGYRLHAARVRLPHPEDQRGIEVVAPAPGWAGG